MVFSPDGTQVLTASGDNTARFWDARNGEKLATLDYENSALLLSANYSENGLVVLSRWFVHTISSAALSKVMDQDFATLSPNRLDVIGAPQQIGETTAILFLTVGSKTINLDEPIELRESLANKFVLHKNSAGEYEYPYFVDTEKGKGDDEFIEPLR